MKTIGQLIKEELIKLAINDKLPQDLNELDANLFDKIAMGESKQFPNGFTSWVETHHEIVEYITIFLNGSDWNPTSESTIAKVMNNFGTGGIYELAEDWADEFEDNNKHNSWSEDDFFDSILHFCHDKNYGDVS